MRELTDDYRLWDEFLKEWPIERLATMTLEQYTASGTQGTFTHWLEQKLTNLGSIWGGSAFKFGVYSRGEFKDKSGESGRRYNERYGWYARLGDSPARAFEKVREAIVEIAWAARRGETHRVDAIGVLGEKTCWKIAFLYQDRDRPTIVNVYKRPALVHYLKGEHATEPMDRLQRAVLARKREADGILEFGRDVWLKWASLSANSPGKDNSTEQTASDDSEGPPTEAQRQAMRTSQVPVNRIYFGPPGTGKTYQVLEIMAELSSDAESGMSDNPNFELVTFHQSYGYEEFVEGLRPVLRRHNEGEAGGDVAYEIRDGVFKGLCDRARKEPERRFAIFIDEINRGNVSKIFGELITLIEPDKRYRGDDNPGLSVTLPYSQTKFSVPANVEIYGTMNTADRSLTALDTALRRRFEFVECPPDTRLAGPLSDPKFVDVVNTPLGIDIRQMLETMNRRIEVLFDRDHRIGHAYFLGLKDAAEPMNALAEVFKKRIVPLLQEYFFDDWQKIRLVLGDNQKPRELQFVRTANATSAHLFGNDDEWGSRANREIYELNAEAFRDFRAYRGIYEPVAVK